MRVYRVLMEPEYVGKVIGDEPRKPGKWPRIAIAAVVCLIMLAGGLLIWNFYFHTDFEPASLDKMAYPLPDKPSIAVLLFTYMSGDPNQEYFSDGITENIITALTYLRNIFVISRNSTFTYKGKAVKVQKVAEELGVQYVLEGSIQKAKERVRITAQLIDALTEKHLWAARYDRDLKDIFALQDEITIKIITSLGVKLQHGEQLQSRAEGINNLEIFLKYLQAGEYLLRMNKEGNVLARQKAEELIAKEPDFAGAHYILGVAAHE